MGMGAEIALDRMIDYYCQELDADRGVWVTADGKEIHIKEMSTQHIKNCLRLLEEQTDDISETYKKQMREELVRRIE